MRGTNFLWAIGCSLVLACGGTEANVNDGGGNNDGSSNPNDGGGNPNDGGGNPNDGGGNPNDGGGNPTDGGVVSNPGQIDCNGQTCSASTDVCCVRYQDGGVNTSCTTAQMCQMGARLACDEKADCMGNDICCFGATGMTGIGTHCQAPAMGMNACGQFAVQVCKTSNECGMGGMCAPHQCPNLGTVWTCTKPFGCN